MDFLQTIFKTNIFLSCILEIYIIMFDATYDPVVRNSKGMQKTPEFDATYDPIVTKSKGMQNKLQNFMQHMTL